MAIGVVDRLEVVEVDQQQGQTFLTASGISHLRFGVLNQVAAIRQVGQRIVPGRVLQLLLAQRKALISAFQFGGTAVHRGL